MKKMFFQGRLTCLDLLVVGVVFGLIVGVVVTIALCVVVSVAVIGVFMGAVNKGSKREYKVINKYRHTKSVPTRITRNT